MKHRLANTEAAGYTEAVESVTNKLRRAIERSGQTRADISRATGIPQSTLSRFVVQGKALRGENIDIVCAHLGLTLAPISAKGAKPASRKGR